VTNLKRGDMVGCETDAVIEGAMGRSNDLRFFDQKRSKWVDTQYGFN